MVRNGDIHRHSSTASKQLNLDDAIVTVK